MKKKILIIALVCILAGVAAFYIVKVNKMYPQGSVTEYELNEPVELNGYSASVSSYKVMSIEDFLNEYGIDKRKDISDEQDDLYVMVAECTLDITGEMKGFPYADIRLASGAFSQGISNEIPSVTFIINAPVTNNVIYIIAIVAAFLTVSLSILLSKK